MTRSQRIGALILSSSLIGWAGPGASAFTLFANASTPVDTPTASVEAVVGYLEGTMSTVAQANSDPDFVGVQMTTCQVEVSDSQPGSIYLYQEQALVETLDSPYRQRFLQIAPGAGDRIDSNTFKPSNPSNWVGFCDQPARTVSLGELGEQACTVSLRVSAIGGFVGSTPAGGCAANIRGAVSITNVVVLHAAGMDTWDRGFDAAGNQVWGAEALPYRYRR